MTEKKSSSGAFIEGFAIRDAKPTPSAAEQFTANAAKYAASLVHRFGPSLPKMLEFAKVSPSDVVLDVATGTGNTALAFAREANFVTGADIAEGMLEQARKRALEDGVNNVKFVTGSAEALPFADSSFDLVTSRHAPHHFHDASKFLSEVYRVLKPGGRFVMADQITQHTEDFEWMDTWQRTRDATHFKQRLIPEWTELVQRAGLTWIADALVPYRLEFATWVQDSGSSKENIAALKRYAFDADAVRRRRLRLEFDDFGQIAAFRELMLVVHAVKY
jgi:ubiquinone/menaquinone biosynthesis C-methylase UbiE